MAPSFSSVGRFNRADPFFAFASFYNFFASFSLSLSLSFFLFTVVSRFSSSLSLEHDLKPNLNHVDQLPLFIVVPIHLSLSFFPPGAPLPSLPLFHPEGHSGPFHRLTPSIFIFPRIFWVKCATLQGFYKY